MATIFNTAARAARFVPEVWISGIFMALEAELVLGSPLIVNRDYEGEIQAMGDTVRIPTVTDPTTQDYDPTVGFAGDPAENTGASLTFEIEKAKAFRFRVEDITRVQSQIGGQYMDHGVQRAGRKLAEAADSYIAQKLVDAVPSGNRLIDVDLTGTVDALYKQIVQVKVQLDKTNTPRRGRFMVITPDLHGLLLQDSRFVDASQYASDAPIKNGVVGRILGFEVAVCNAMPTDVHLVAGHQIATTFAEQLVEVEYYRPEKFFADAVRGLYVFGGQVMRPEHLAIGKIIP
ncbi:N4-gp56 family major capsid protein [Streptosporangium sp. NPDC020072]|uniref:N4-gp56 family major capsid protein n=1 Tax=Streptosporangium sp. NPDC020072 TaxID=3154788 RepID=UPI00343BC6B9